jgi:hypothetical protein
MRRRSLVASSIEHQLRGQVLEALPGERETNAEEAAGARPYKS